MPAIQLRRQSAITPGEPHLVGEPMWDPTNSRFGVFNNRAPTAVEWYPAVIGNKLLLNPSQTLGGKITNGAENNIYIDWSVQDQITIRNRNTNAVYATLAAAGASFNAIASVGTPYLGLTNLLLNGNMAVKRAAVPFTTQNTGTVAGRSYLIAPNIQMWRTDGTAGTLVVQWLPLTAGTLPYAGCLGVLAIAASGAPNSSGIRMFLHDYDLVDNREITLSYYILGTSGAQTSMRAVTDNGINLFSDAHNANGEWQRFTKTFTPPSNNSSKWIGFDLLYNPSGNTAQLQNWRIAGVQLQYGDSASIFENRPLVLEQALCQNIYTEGKLKLLNASDARVVPLNNFALGPKVEAVETGAKPVTISDIDAYGFNVQVPSLTAASYVKYAAYQMPTVTETA